MAEPANLAFEAACKQASAGDLGRLSDADQLALYGLYSVAHKGPARGPAPSALNFRARAKFDAWEAVSDLSAADAMARYIDLVTRLARRGPVKGEVGGELGRQAPTGFDIDGDSGGARSIAPDLCYWASVGDVRSLLYLLRAGRASPDYRDEDGLTATMRAADRNHVRCLDVLLAAGADLAAQDRDGLSALHYAALCGHAEAAGVLILAGADLSLPDGDGNTPLEAADEATKAVILAAKKGEWARPPVHSEDVRENRLTMDRVRLALGMGAGVVLIAAVAFRF